MNKDAYYFPHFCNARHDRKVKRLRKQLGVEGYGIYFMLLEVLREQDGFKYPLEDIDLLADEFDTSQQKVDAVIKGYKLFEVDEQQMFFSPKFNKFMDPYLKAKEQRRLAGIKSGESRRKKSKKLNGRSTDDERKLNGRSTDDERNGNENEQSKVKESKEKKSSSIGNIYDFYNKNISLVTQYIAEDIGNFIDDGLSEDLVIRAMQLSCDNDKKSWGYIKTILNDCISRGIKNLDQFELKELKRNNKIIQNKVLVQSSAGSKKIPREDESKWEEWENQIP